ncbi:MAG: HDIG domain-containing protein [Actinobacteria bacterium]|nr:HDIG domain-containing protein [Actinomycetota bacterium]
MRRTSVSTRRRVVAAVLLVLVTVILSIEISPFGYLVVAGKPARRAIYAPRTVQYIDEKKTGEERDAAAAAVEDVYRVDPAVANKVSDNIRGLFDVIENAAAQPLPPEQKLEAVQIPYPVTTDTVEALLAMDPEQRVAVENSALELAAGVMLENVTGENLSDNIGKLMAITGTGQQAAQVAAAFLEVNAVRDSADTERRREAAREAVKPVITTKLQGEVIINKGETVTAEQLDLLRRLGFQRPVFTPLNVLYTLVFSILLLGAVAMFLAKYRRVVYQSPGLLSLLGSQVVVYALAARLITVAASNWSPVWGYLMPAAAVAIITAVLFDTGVALVIVAVCSLVTGVVTSGNFTLVAVALLGGFFPSLIVSRTSTRHQLRRASLYTAFWVAAVAFGASALTQLNADLLINAGVGFINGAVCGVVAMGALPFLETTFRVTTNTWLLELASPEQELLKDLSARAPGTYSHSVMVANLAEAAAREVGSDTLMARVAAYYHDVGKMKRPQFFVENQQEGVNAHEGLSPNLSALIITSHVRDGVEMLQAEHIPPDLVEIVREHHGTSMVRYFYEKAMDQDTHEDVEESRFRYHFPKPHRRTAGILMLADSVEATARTLDKPSAATIEQMVSRIIDGKMADGQLDDCELTYSDLTRIKAAFSRILIGAYHPRVDYPQTTAAGGERSDTRKAGGSAAGQSA